MSTNSNDHVTQVANCTVRNVNKGSSRSTVVGSTYNLDRQLVHSLPHYTRAISIRLVRRGLSLRRYTPAYAAAVAKFHPRQRTPSQTGPNRRRFRDGLYRAVRRTPECTLHAFSSYDESRTLPSVIVLPISDA